MCEIISCSIAISCWTYHAIVSMTNDFICDEWSHLGYTLRTY